MGKHHEGWTPDLLKEHIEDRLNLISHDLEGFPEKYATQDDVRIVRGLVEDIRQDHVHRREIDEVKEQLHEGAGRRVATVIAISVVATLLGVMFAAVWQQQPTHAEIRAQIQTEAPWVSERPGVEARIDKLEQEVTVLQTQVATLKVENAAIRKRVADIEALNKFFCRTRTPTLPSC